MPRYFFDIADGDETIDEEGQDLEDAASVPQAALATLFDIAKYEAIANGERLMAVMVRDETGTLVYRASVSVAAGWVVREA